MKIFKHLHQAKRRAKVVQDSGESALGGSAKLPNSGFAFVDNSQGSSAAIAELSGSLDVALEQIDYERNPGDQLQLQLQRLYKEAAKYANSSLDGDTPAEEWNCSSVEAEVVSAAFSCAAAVYDPESEPSIAGFACRRDAYIAPTAGGTVKATAVSLVERTSPASGGGGGGGGGRPASPLLPMLVVAVRGTASRVDRMVMLNGRSKDMGALLVSGSDPARGNVDDLLSPRPADVCAHAGFLNGAEALVPAVAKHIDALAENKSAVKHVLFTGHSAGGAVASLLFAKFLSLAPTQYPSLLFSSISFGAPPVTRPDLTHPILAAANRGLVLSIVNEYDLVPRADNDYVRSLVDLYRSIYSLPPIQDRPEQDPTPRLPRLSFDTRNANPAPDPRPSWPLPSPEYFHIGQIVVFKVKLAEPAADGGAGGGAASDADDLVLRAVTVAPNHFARLLFGSVSVHGRVCYRERVKMLLEGRFNGRESWAP
ncbi:hypothetical protein GP486_003311 [Trichoglossum hirsutum]|uniref:Fungal lipase-type domain-containing protein n=1 Tax=Trichoglossum hirsutum TaxID=265104 RepID=A0A9P8LCU4_9PEZI|nr:hypothetical protein GP486_003311 [Trichoglossum hirsutum]